MTHEIATTLLAPYADGALPQAEASAVRAHVAECHACSAEVRGLEQLNRALVFPAAPPVAFPRFWAGIQQALPRRRQPRVPVMRGSLALAFALACLLVLATAASAFASDRILPDNPLYPVKRVGETLRLDLTLSRHEQVRLRLRLAAERLREAKTMAQKQKNRLAVASLRDFQSLLTQAKPALEHQVPADQPETRQQIATLEQALVQVEEAARAEPDPHDAQVQAVVQDSQASLAQVEQEASPSADVQPIPTPEGSPMPRETPEASAGPRETPQQQDSATPTAS